MKKILLSSVVLLIFALSITIFQLSCQKEADAEIPSSNDVAQLNKIIYMKTIDDNNGYGQEIWIANYDGSVNAKVNIILPNNIYFQESSTPLLSPDGKKIFFAAGPAGNQGHKAAWESDIYSCDVDGSNVSKIVDKGGAYATVNLGGAY